jgi:hypothetical protein
VWRSRKFVCVRFEVLIKMWMLVFWVVTPRGLLGRYRRFGGTYYLQLQGQGPDLKPTPILKFTFWTGDIPTQVILTQVLQPWRWKWYVSQKRCWPPTRLHDVTTQNTIDSVDIYLQIMCGSGSETVVRVGKWSASPWSLRSVVRKLGRIWGSHSRQWRWLAVFGF